MKEIKFGLFEPKEEKDIVKLGLGWSNEVSAQEISSLVIEFEKFLKKEQIKSPFNTDFLARNIIMHFTKEQLSNKKELIIKWLIDQGCNNSKD